MLRESAQQATDAIRRIAKAANDALKDGAKSYTSQHVKDNIKSGKLPIDAFFEGLKKAAVDNAHDGFVAAEKQRKTTKALGAVHPALPVFVAKLMYEAQDATYKSAYDEQRQATLPQWLDYQARRRSAQWSASRPRRARRSRSWT